MVRASGTDRFGNPVLAERLLTISGKKDETKLRILADRTTFKVGESAEVRLVNRGPAGTALLTWEADRILSYKIVPLQEGENALTWEVEGPQFPNFTLAASRMAASAFHEARLDVRVERDLRVTITPRAPSVGPGGEVEVEVSTTDQNGKPVAAELSIALVDRSLLRLFGDRLPTIDRFFYDQSRTSAFATQSSATFRYQPATVPVPEAVVEDAAQQAAQLADAAERRRGEAGKPGTSPSSRPPPARAAAAAPPRPGMAGMGGMGGGMAARPSGADMALSTRSDSRDGAAAGAEVAADESGKQLSKDELGSITSEDRRVAEGRRGPPPRGVALGRARERRGRSLGQGGRTSRPAPRERFVETAYWNPSVVTGTDGKAVVKFRAPAALSEYRFTARGVSGRDTLVGQATADLAVRKDFFVDLKVPSALTQGDKPRFSAEVHHRGVVGTLELRLTIYAGGRERRRARRRIDVKADGVEEVLFDPFDVPDGDEVRLTLAAALGEAKDEMTVAVPIRPWGVQAFASASGSSTDDTTAFVALPPGRRYEQPEMLVVISPTVRRMLIELAMGEDAYRIEDRSRFCIPRPPHTTADRAGDLLAAGAAVDLPAIDQGDGHTRGRPPDRPGPRTGLRAGLAPERGRRLALGRRHEGSSPAERSHDLGPRRLGARDRRVARPDDRRRGPGQGGDLAGPGIRQGRGRRQRDPRHAAARPEHPQQGVVRAGQRPEPRPPGAFRTCRSPTWRSTFANLDRVSLGGRGPRRARPARQGRADRPRGQAPTLLVGSRPAPVASIGRRDHGAGGPGLRPRPAGRARPRRGLRLAAGPSPGDRLAAAQGEGSGAGGAGEIPRLRPGRRGPLSPGRHRE